MKVFTLLFLLLSLLSCSGDDEVSALRDLPVATKCDCEWQVYRNGVLQPGWTEPTQIDDCDRAGEINHWDDELIRVLVCDQIPVE